VKEERNLLREGVLIQDGNGAEVKVENRDRAFGSANGMFYLFFLELRGVDILARRGAPRSASDRVTCGGDG
jgi:hypothetical protein